MPANCTVIFSYAGEQADAEGVEVFLGVLSDEKSLVRVSREIKARYGSPAYGFEHDVPWYRTNREPGQVHVVVNCDTDRAVGRAVFDDRNEAEAFTEQERSGGEEVCLVTATMGVMDYSRFGAGSRCP